MADTMKLYSYWRSQASYRVRIALHLKGLKSETVSLDLIKAVRRRLPGAQFRDGCAHLDRWRRSAAGAVARDPGIYRRSLSAAAAVAVRHSRAGACAGAGADGGDGCAPVRGAAGAQIS